MIDLFEATLTFAEPVSAPSMTMTAAAEALAAAVS
jgi:hypothetical protein